jgi:hypothetical protein
MLDFVRRQRQRAIFVVQVMRADREIPARIRPTRFKKSRRQTGEGNRVEFRIN